MSKIGVVFIVILILIILLLSIFIAKNELSNNKKLSSNNIDIPSENSSSLVCNLKLLSCENNLKDATAEKELWKGKFEELAKLVNSEYQIKNEYEDVISSCYNRNVIFDSSGIEVFEICPTCQHKIDCSSWSMMPLINCNSKVQIDKVRSEKDVKVCDVIEYKLPNGKLLIHRVWKIYKDENSTTRYMTAGDNSNIFDGYDPQFSDIIGEVGKVVSQ